MKFLTTRLDDIGWVRHGFFTRDSSAAPFIANVLHLQEENIVSLKQTHSAKVVVFKERWTKAPEGDALVTAERGIGLAVITADCAPVLFASRKDKIVGAAHAGWRGAVGGVLEETVAAMEKLGAGRSDIVAAIGPCIGPLSYEVSEGFEKPFVEREAEDARFFTPAEKAGHLMFDLPGYVAERLHKAGVSTAIHTRQDTLSNEKAYYSHRRATLRGEKDCGRQLSVIGIKS